MEISKLKILNILNPQISPKHLSLQKWPILPFEELALFSFEDNLNPLPYKAKMYLSLSSWLGLEFKSHDIPTSNEPGTKKEERTVPQGLLVPDSMYWQYPGVGYVCLDAECV